MSEALIQSQQDPYAGRIAAHMGRFATAGLISPAFDPSDRPIEGVVERFPNKRSTENAVAYFRPIQNHLASATSGSRFALNAGPLPEPRGLFVQTLSGSMRFCDAVDRFLELRRAPNLHGRAQFSSGRTYKDYEGIFKRLGIFFGEILLENIHIGHIVEYQRRRATGDGFTRKCGRRVIVSPCGPNKINQEIGQLARLMRMAGCWTETLRHYYMPMQRIDSDFHPALSPAEQERFLAVAASNKDWHIVYWYALVALHTSFSSDEMRTIRLGDVNRAQGILGVNRKYGKNRYRRREVPIEDDACMWALERLMERANHLTGTAPHYHLFPLRMVRNHYDGSKPMSATGIRKPFDAVRKAAGLPWFRLNGFRHTAITRLAEAGVPIAIIQRRAGHMTQAMTAHYTHISEQEERHAVARVSQRKPMRTAETLRQGSSMSGR